MVESVSQKQSTSVSFLQKINGQTKRNGVYAGAAVAGGIVGSTIGYSAYSKKAGKLSELKDSFEKTKPTEESVKLRENISSDLCDLIRRTNEGNTVSMPNSILLVTENNNYAKNVSDWIANKSNANYIKIDTQTEELLDALELAEDNHKNGNWTIIHAENLDKYINKQQQDKSVVESVKDILSASAEDYHSTIIFSTKNPKELDEIALQPHRVKSIFYLDTVPEKDFFAPENMAKMDKEIKTMEKSLSKTKILSKFGVVGAIIGLAGGVILNQIIRSKDDSGNTDSITKK